MYFLPIFFSPSTILAKFLTPMILQRMKSAEVSYKCWFIFTEYKFLPWKKSMQSMNWNQKKTEEIDGVGSFNYLHQKLEATHVITFRMATHQNERAIKKVHLRDVGCLYVMPTRRMPIFLRYLFGYFRYVINTFFIA